MRTSLRDLTDTDEPSSTTVSESMCVSGLLWISVEIFDQLWTAAASARTPPVEDVPAARITPEGQRPRISTVDMVVVLPRRVGRV
jgi:hypothetical protein